MDSLAPDDDDLAGVSDVLLLFRRWSGSTDRVEDVVVIGSRVRTRDETDEDGVDDDDADAVPVKADDEDGLGLPIAKF